LDSYAPDVLSGPSQSNSSPEYNESVDITIQVFEPTDASRIDTVWLNYTIDGWTTFIIKNITSSQSYTFISDLLEYDQVYQWTIGFNDTSGNIAYTEEQMFRVIDNIVPDVLIPAAQSTNSPQFNDSVVVSINVTEPEDASGLNSVWLNYTSDNWNIFVIEMISSTQSYIFDHTMLDYNQTYQWKIGFNDSAGNMEFSEEFNFSVIDTYSPDLITAPSQSTSSPEYNGTVFITIQVFEQTDASGIDTVWLNYTTDDWTSYKTQNITITQSYTFLSDILNYSQQYKWIIYYKVDDNYKPDIIESPTQNTSFPEFNNSVLVTINVSEPMDASGIDYIWLNYTLDNWITFVIEDITSTQEYIFTEMMLTFDQIYKWNIGFNDSAGNTGISDEFMFTVIDSYAPDVEIAANQSISKPEFNGTVNVYINVSEPNDASGLSKVWLNYTTDDWFTFTSIDISSIQNYTFTQDLLEYGQVYKWRIGYNDTVDNFAYSKELNFTVVDSYSPDIVIPPSQTTSTPAYNSSVEVSIDVYESPDASGINMVWINFTNDNWLTFTIVNITETKLFSFTEDTLVFDQIYYWFIAFNDSAGNIGYTEDISFIVIDSYAPDVTIEAIQSTNYPEYNGSVDISIMVNESIDASGLSRVWLNYTTDNWYSFNITDITTTQEFTFDDSKLEFNQHYQWVIGYNDTAGNAAFSQEFNFTVTDPFSPDIIIPASQNTSTPEYNGSVLITIQIDEPADASGISTIWINYTTNNWNSFTTINITGSQDFVFNETFLIFNQRYYWKIGYNDSMGNTDYTGEFEFLVIDSSTPDIIIPASHTTSVPEYNDTVVASIQVYEPSDSSGIDNIWINYTLDDWLTFTLEDITISQSFTFDESMLEYNQIYIWTVGYNDTAGNEDFSDVLSFTVKDTYAPGITDPANQTSQTPEYDENNTVSVSISEPDDASGVDTILLYYRVNSGVLWLEEDCTSTSNYTFTADMLSYGEVYDWYFWFNDTAGNYDLSQILTFTVVDLTGLEYSNLTQTTSTPQYNGSNTVSINVSEPEHASGVDMILLNYRVDGGGWNIVDCTPTSNYTFTAEKLFYGEEFSWYFWFNDTAANNGSSTIQTFTVIDSYKPEIIEVPSQTTASPEYNGTVIVSINVTEPASASGMDTVWLNYTTNNWVSYVIENINISQTFIFNESQLIYGQVYQWVIGANDTANNRYISEESTFTVIDTFIPDIVKNPNQTTTNPEYNGSVIVSIDVYEPNDASGIDLIWLNYTKDDWVTFIIENITLTQEYVFTEDLLEFGQNYKWKIGYNDTVGNLKYTQTFSFSVVDIYEPDVVFAASQTTNFPEYNESVLASIQVYEPSDASGLNKIWINYTFDDWNTEIVVDITSNQIFNFTDAMLDYNGICSWIIGYNDTAGNIGYSDEFTFTVTDSFAPYINESATQSTDSPEYNGSVEISIQVDEPLDASQIDMVWLNYTNNGWIDFTVIDITATQTYIFDDSLLYYGQIYYWVIGYNDTASNFAFSEELTFIVEDNFIPDTLVAASQSESYPEYNDTVYVSIDINEPLDASGLDTVWLNYTTDDWMTYFIVDITSTQSFTFTETMLEYNQTYYWKIGYNDTAGNTDYSEEFTFSVIDTYLPGIITPSQQLLDYPEFNDTNFVSILVSEPDDASGLSMVWINYTIDNWNTFALVNITSTQSFVFNAEILEFGKTYQWVIGYNDTAGNTDYSVEHNFTVTDNYAPDVIIPANQTTSNPEFNGTVYASITVSEPDDASGLNKVWILYTTNNWYSYSVTDVSLTQSFTFDEAMLNYGQIYQWKFRYEDMNGNTQDSSEQSFTVIDSYSPEIIVPESQTDDITEYNGTITVSISIFESSDAAGLDTIWLNYTIDNWQTNMIENITVDQSYTFNEDILQYNQTYKWYIGFNDTAGNTAYSNKHNFSVIDSYAPDIITPASQTTQTPEYNGTVYTFINVTEPLDAAGVNCVWINYTKDNWLTMTIINITQNQSFTFEDVLLDFDDNYQWFIGYNDSAGNIASSGIFSFIVLDSYAPDVTTKAFQTINYPDYNESVTTSIMVIEPSDASGIDTVWINYTINDWNSFYVEDITLTQTYTFSEDVLEFSQTYKWMIYYNDTVGNLGSSEELIFTVIDSYAPDIIIPASQTDFYPEFNESVVVSINVSEPQDSSGLDKVWINYTSNNWNSFDIVDISLTQSFVFEETMLEYGQTYYWFLGFNDSNSNTAFSEESTFNVVDNFAPDVESSPAQTTSSPEYNASVTISIKVNETSDAAGLDKVWINYTSDDWNTNTVVDITETQSFTFNESMLVYDQTYLWFIGYNDTINNTAFTKESMFLVTDSYSPDILVPAYQSTESPEFNGSVFISITMNEPSDAAGIDKVWLNYTTDDWMTYFIVDMTSTQSFTFSEDVLEYDQFYRWMIFGNDTMNNTAWSEELSFTVVDSYIPDVLIHPTQNTSSPQYNDSVAVSIQVNEPNDAAGIDKVWLNYSIDNWMTLTIVDITSDQSFVFDDTILEYNQIYQWNIGYNDTVGNKAFSEEYSFQVFDNYAPDIISEPIQTTSSPQYNGSNTVSIVVDEPSDAAGLDKVWIHYTNNNWSTYTVADISTTQIFTFSEGILEYNQTYEWKIVYKDKIDNTAETKIFNFTVIDSYTPDVMISANQTTNTPEFNGTVITFIYVSEASDASGIDTVWINYTRNNWISFTIINITETQDYTFTDTMLEFDQTYYWIIGYNDTAGNFGESSVQTFEVIDSYKPDLIVPPTQSTATPEFNGTVTVSIDVTEPLDASGLDKIWLNYTTNNWTDFLVIDISLTESFIFNDSLLRYNQIYQWLIGFNDSIGNVGYTNEFIFTVIDSYAPDVELPANQSTSTPEFNGTVATSISVFEPEDAAGLDDVWINYTMDDWATFTIINITKFQMFTFLGDVLEFNQIYKWVIYYNDTVNNIATSEEFSFTVVDSYAPDVDVTPTQSTASPEFNGTVEISVYITEPLDASGLDKVWINYTSDDWNTNTVVDITETQTFSFNESILVYDQTYQWFIGYNDTLDNTGFTTVYSFSVIDTFSPDIIDIPNQSNSTPEFNETVTIMIGIEEPDDAAGLDDVWINYTVDNWLTFSIIDITPTQQFIFSDELFSYNQVYQWLIGFNDTLGNTGYSNELNFTIADTYQPDIIGSPNQSTDTPEYNGSVDITITVNEPIDASGLDTVWLNYSLNNWGFYYIIDISENQSYTFNENILIYGQTCLWLIGFNDTVGNTGYTKEHEFMVIDSYAPDLLESAFQTTSNPEFNGSVGVSINVSEPIDASGIDTVWINYTIDNWITDLTIDITQSQTFTFNAETLMFSQVYHWIIGYNDSTGNLNFSPEFNFSVIDTYSPDIVEEASQTTSTPEYNDANTISIIISEPIDASGVDTLLLYYNIDDGPWTIEDVSITSYFTFSPDNLTYDQQYQWYFWFNDTEGNENQTIISSFIVTDNTAPTYSNLNQSTDTPEYSQSNNVSIVVSEPSDASGIDNIFLYYRVNSEEWIAEDCTSTSNYTFTADKLSYGQVYDWYFWFNDTAGNNDTSQILTFTVVDYTGLEYSNLTQTTSTPQYNGSNTVSIVVSEPEHASGVDMILLNYRVNGGGWNIVDCTATSNYTFTAEMLFYGQEFSWYFRFNDTAGNNGSSSILSFAVIDSYAPDIIQDVNQSTGTPEFNGTVEVSISVNESLDASGIDKIWINYTVDNWMTYTVIDITTTQTFTFTDTILEFNQSYLWVIGFSDISGNTGFSNQLTFKVIDSYSPDIFEKENQSTQTPEYNGSVIVSINISEPLDAAGIDSIWINYTTDNWLSFIIENITDTQSFVFTDTMLIFDQTYNWKIGYNICS
jgi:hypothetical protein